MDASPVRRGTVGCVRYQPCSDVRLYGCTFTYGKKNRGYMLSRRPYDRTTVRKNVAGNADWPKTRVTTAFFPSRLVMRYRTGCVHMMGIDRTAICVFISTSGGRHQRRIFLKNWPGTPLLTIPSRLSVYILVIGVTCNGWQRAALTECPSTCYNYAYELEDKEATKSLLCSRANR